MKNTNLKQKSKGKIDDATKDNEKEKKVFYSDFYFL